MHHFFSPRTFAANDRGNIAVIFGICAIPITMAVSIGLDMSNASSMKSDIQAAADSAVLAAATRLAVNASDADKEQIAVDTFYANLSPVLASHIIGSPDVAIDFPGKTVHMGVSVNAQPLLGSLVTDEVELFVEATAGVSSGTPICMMALNPDAEKSLSIQGTADIMATGCAIHVNSGAEDNALYQNGNGTATAASFCVAGGHSGSNFSPSPEDNCMVERDPLLSTFLSDWSDETISSDVCTETDMPQINTSASTTTNLSPGVYCGGLSIKKGIVQLQTNGIYVFRDGPLHVQSGGTLQGTNVTVLFEGNSDTRLITQAGASIITSARSSSPFKGIAFAQHPDSIPASENLIIGGGTMQINGIVYFPAQPLKITGNGDIGTTSAQFAIMADTISIEGNGQLNIRIGQDYQSSGLPDLPEADEIVRLTE
jgi:Putative Flp pilus-assembly TadE/G-like